MRSLDKQPPLLRTLIETTMEVQRIRRGWEFPPNMVMRVRMALRRQNPTTHERMLDCIADTLRKHAIKGPR